MSLKAWANTHTQSSLRGRPKPLTPDCIYKYCPRRRSYQLYTHERRLLSSLELCLSSLEFWSFLSDKITLLTTLYCVPTYRDRLLFYQFLSLISYIYKSLNRWINRLNFSITDFFFCSLILPAPKTGIGGSTFVISIPFSST